MFVALAIAKLQQHAVPISIFSASVVLCGAIVNHGSKNAIIGEKLPEKAITERFLEKAASLAGGVQVTLDLWNKKVTQETLEQLDKLLNCEKEVNRTKKKS